MKSIIAIVLCLGLVNAQSKEETLPKTIDDLYDKFDKSADNIVTIEEMNAFFAGFDGGAEEYSLDEAKFVAGWKAAFPSQDDNEAAAFFRAFDFIALDDNCRVDGTDIAFLFDRIGFFGAISEESFKGFTKAWYAGHFFVIVFNEFRTKGTGQYDDFISADTWLEDLATAINPSADGEATVESWNAFWTGAPRNLATEGAARRIFLATDANRDQKIDEDEWINVYLQCKALPFYPVLEQLHFEEFMQYEEAALGTPRP